MKQRGLDNYLIHVCNTQFFPELGPDWGSNKDSEWCPEWNLDWSPDWVLDKRVPRVKAAFCTWIKQSSGFILFFSSLTLQLTYHDYCFIYRFHVAFEHLTACGMSTASGQLFFLQTVLNLLAKASSVVLSKDALWRLWCCIVDHLNEHIQKTNDVNQGDALEHDFSTLYSALTFPVKHLLDAKLPQELGKEVNKTLVELYRSFSRAAALVPTAEANICCEELCTRILSVGSDWKNKDLIFVDTLVNLIVVAIECLDFSIPGLFAMATTAAGKSPNTTPTKWNKRLQKPMGNFTSVVNLAAKLLSACERTSDSKVTVLTCHITSCSFFKLLPPELYSYKEVPWEHSAKIYWRFLKTPRFNLDLYLRVPQRRTIFLSLNMRFYASHLNLHSLRNSLNFLTKLSLRTS